MCVILRTPMLCCTAVGYVDCGLLVCEYAKVLGGWVPVPELSLGWLRKTLIMVTFCVFFAPKTHL